MDSWPLVDLLLFVGTPAVLIPFHDAAEPLERAKHLLFVGVLEQWDSHLPGMIRAYGDRALFQRFKTRFLIAPLVIVGVCVWSAFYDIQAVQLLALAWGIWHGMMQTYGFCRIHDSKSSAKAAARARIDWALCFVWFIGAVLLSPLQFRNCLELYDNSGGPIIPRFVFEGLRAGVAAALAAAKWRSSGGSGEIFTPAAVSAWSR